jgi:PAS domain S-box-containing protein
MKRRWQLGSGVSRRWIAGCCALLLAPIAAAQAPGDLRDVWQYRTLWVYLAYLLAAGLVVAAVVKWRSRRQRRERSAFELEIAARSRAEAALRESEYQLRVAVEGARMSAWTLDLRTDEVTGVEQMAAILGVDHEVYGNRSSAYRQLTHPDDRERVERTLAEAFQTQGGGDYEIEHRVVRPDGSIVWLYGKGRVLCDELGQPQSMTGLSCDITERKQAEAERERLFAELEAQHAELERFTYTVSHDLRTPLVTIKNYAGALRHHAATGDVRRMEDDVERICKAADRMHRLLGELLELSRIGRVVHPSQEVPLGELVDEAVELLAPRFGERGVELSVDGELPVVVGDRGRLSEVVLNLLENAVKYLGDQPRPRIEIGARPGEGSPIFYVRDNGRGIDSRYHDKVFGLFERLDAAEEGTGVGLALVKRIVEHHGGRIWVESQGRGHGCTFCFALPGMTTDADSEAVRRDSVSGSTPFQE